MIRLVNCQNDVRKLLATTRGRYVVLDLYEGIAELLYDGNSLHDARIARKERYADTDGEATVIIPIRDTGDAME